MSGISDKKIKDSSSKKSVRSSSKQKSKKKEQLPRVATIVQSDSKEKAESVHLKLSSKSPKTSSRSSRYPPMPLRNA
jgi:hypothetical protein